MSSWSKFEFKDALVVLEGPETDDYRGLSGYVLRLYTYTLHKALEQPGRHRKPCGLKTRESPIEKHMLAISR